MSIQWKKLFLSLGYWLIAELCFNFLGIDDMADYTEFITEQNRNIPSRNYHLA